MLSDTQFPQWCQQVKLSPVAQALITQVRAAPPVRHVRSRAGNVSGRYPRPCLQTYNHYSQMRMQAKVSIA
jgi:hypothetical protein